MRNSGVYQGQAWTTLGSERRISRLQWLFHRRRPVTRPSHNRFLSFSTAECLESTWILHRWMSQDHGLSEATTTADACDDRAVRGKAVFTVERVREPAEQVPGR